MGSFLFRVLANGVALWVASLIVPGIVFGEGAEPLSTVLTIAAVGLVFGLLNAVLRPILFVLSLPVLILTGYHAWHAARADLLRRLGRSTEAKASYTAAIAATLNSAERSYLGRKRGELV